MEFIIDKFAQRLGGSSFGKHSKESKFQKIRQAKIQAKQENPNISLIDLGMGEPDKPASEQIVEILYNEAGKPGNRLYAHNGIPEFQEAACRFLKKLYKINDMDPYENIIHGIGSKSILAMLPLCFINPGDITLITTPSYAVISTYTKYLGGEVYTLPLYEQNDYYPDFSIIPDTILKRAKILYLNYPNNPTAKIASVDFFKEVIDFAYKNDIIVIHDAAYSAIVFDENKPFSFLNVDGAFDVGVEVHTLSKSFNMTGWRLGFVAGNKKAIKAYATIKDSTDYGQFRAIQKAGIYALDHPELISINCTRYSRRFDLLVEVLKELGFDVEKPKATFYCYVPIPKGTKSGVVFKNAEQTADYFIKKALISTVPWDDAGSFLRLSVNFKAENFEQEKKAVSEVQTRLKQLELVF